MQAVLVVHELLRNRFLYLFMNFSDDRVEVVLVLQLQLLVVATALVGSSLLEDFGEPKEDLCFPARFLCEEVVDIIDHELKVDLILLIIPLSHRNFRLAWFEAHFLDLVEFRLKTLFIGILDSFAPHAGWL